MQIRHRPFGSARPHGLRAAGLHERHLRPVLQRCSLQSQEAKQQTGGWIWSHPSVLTSYCAHRREHAADLLHSLAAAGDRQHQAASHSQQIQQLESPSRRCVLLSAAAVLCMPAALRQPAAAAGDARGSSTDGGPQQLRGAAKDAVDRALAKAMEKSKVRSLLR